MTINYYGELEMKRFCILSLYIFFVSLLYAQTVEVDGAYRWTGVNKSETGLDYVFVIPSSSQATIRFNSTSGSPVNWYRFDRTGINNKTSISNGNSLTYSPAEKDYGYVIEQGDVSVYLWLSTYKEVFLYIRMRSILISVKMFVWPGQVLISPIIRSMGNGRE